MPHTLIKVKFQIPPIRSKWVQRPELIRQLNAGLAQKLILVSASAGYGKSTLLNEWVHQLTVPAAWFSLEDSDNSPSRFWSYFASALRTVSSLGDSGVGESLLHLDGSQLSSFPEEALTRLVDEVSQSPAPVVLVLDDLHLISNSEIHSGLVFLLEHFPVSSGGLHLVVSSRMDPPWPLARMRARAEIAELRTRDLRFTSQESAEFLNHSMGLQLSEQDISRLSQKTEGWVAGMQMAALSIEKLEDIPSFMDRFSGSHRYILDYLIEEVLNQQTPEIQEFLLKTSILERMSAPLCEVVTGVAGSQALLVQLEKLNVFVASLDDEQRWFRYHHLFADLLRRRLEQTYPDQVTTLHRRAAEFYKAEGLIAEMVSHALGGKDYEGLIRLLATDAYTISPSDVSRIVEQLKSSPDETKLAQPWILIAQAWALVLLSNLTEVESCLQMAEAALAKYPPSSEAEANRMKGYILLIRGYWYSQQDNMPKSVEALRSSLEIIPSEDTATRSLAATIASTSLRWSGHLEEGSRYGEEAVAMARTSGSFNALVDVLGDLAILQTLQGKLNRAEQTCLEAIRVAEDYRRQTGKTAPIVGPIYTNYSVILRERNDIGSALDYARKGLLLCQQWGQAPNIFRAYFDLAKAFRVAGDDENAERITRDAEQIARRMSSWFVNRAAILRLWQTIKVGNISTALKWAHENGFTHKDSVTFETYELYSLLSKAYLAERKWKEALELLKKLLKLAESSGALGYMAEVQTLQAVATAEVSNRGVVKGDLNAALNHLKRALMLAEPEGFVRVFVDIGSPIPLLLRQAASREISTSYVKLLLEAFEGGNLQTELPPYELRGNKDDKPHPLFELLSDRELEVLNLLNSKLSVPEIAEVLMVAPSTVRTHIRQIYNKLGVHGRLEAVQKAKDLDLI